MATDLPRDGDDDDGGDGRRTTTNHGWMNDD